MPFLEMVLVTPKWRRIRVVSAVRNKVSPVSNLNRIHGEMSGLVAKIVLSKPCTPPCPPKHCVLGAFDFSSQ